MITVGEMNASTIEQSVSHLICEQASLQKVECTVIDEINSAVWAIAQGSDVRCNGFTMNVQGYMKVKWVK